VDSCRQCILVYLKSVVLFNNKVDVLHVRLTELHAAHQNLPPAIRTVRLKETIHNLYIIIRKVSSWPAGDWSKRPVNRQRHIRGRRL